MMSSFAPIISDKAIGIMDIRIAVHALTYIAE